MKKLTAVIMAADVVLTMSACKMQKSIENSTVCSQISSISESISNYTTEKKSELKRTTKRKTSNPYLAKNLGVFSLTFYTPYEDSYGYRTSTGVRSQHLKTCAVDPRVIPYGSVIQITGNNGKVLTLKAVDCGGGIKGNKIDIFFDGGQREGYAFMEEFGEIHSVYLLEE